MPKNIIIAALAALLAIAGALAFAGGGAAKQAVGTKVYKPPI